MFWLGIGIVAFSGMFTIMLVQVHEALVPGNIQALWKEASGTRFQVLVCWWQQSTTEHFLDHFKWQSLEICMSSTLKILSLRFTEATKNNTSSMEDEQRTSLQLLFQISYATAAIISLQNPLTCRKLPHRSVTMQGDALFNIFLTCLGWDHRFSPLLTSYDMMRGMRTNMVYEN
jgi:hypothetical protein